MIPDEHVCTPACSTFYENVETNWVRAVRTAFAAGLVLGIVLAVLAAVAVAVVR